MVIDGFNESEKNVPARVSLIDRNNNESKAIDVVFDTEESAACSFFNGAEVLPYWMVSSKNMSFSSDIGNGSCYVLGH